MHSKDIDRALEDMIDAKSLHYVLNALAGIALEKAEHLQTNWQDEHAAKQWEKAAKAIDRCEVKVRELGL